MLTATDTRLLHESLRPPRGYELDHLVVTTYSLDLVSLLSVPLAFTSFTVEDGEGALLSDPLLLLEGLRRNGERVTVFCQTGAIAVPLAERSLYVYLEDSVIPVIAPRAGGVFHPKVWVAKYVSDGETPVHRFICLTRNLTGDRSRDTILVMDGAPGRRKSEQSAPLAAFLRWLAKAAKRDGSTRHEAVAALADSLRTTSFVPPTGFTSALFHPLGIPGYQANPIVGRRQRMLVVSPFLGQSRLAKVASNSRGSVLVSRESELAALPPNVAQSFDEIYFLDDSTEPEERDEPETSQPLPGGELRGLHAKVYVADDGWNARIWTGSANATEAAFERNVEFLVELAGRKSACGVESLLGDGDEAGLRSLLTPFEPMDEPVPVEEDNLDRELDRVARAVAAASMRAHVEELDEGYDVILRLDSPVLLNEPSGFKLRCWPVTLAREAFAATLDLGSEPVARFHKLPLTALTCFFAVEARLGEGKSARQTYFVASWPLVGTPGGREQAILLSLLEDSDRVLAFFRMMLSESPGIGDAALARPVLPFGPVAGVALGWAVGDEPLLESLVRALESDPQRLDGIGRIVDELLETEEGDARIPAGFLEIWQPIRAARERLRSTQ